jgi:hypothetical protein
MPRIFVSYAREDDKWFDADSKYNFIPWLEKSLRHYKAELWYDRQLQAGENFEQRIEEEINRADVAILLVSQNFVNSTFIECVELPLIMARVESGAMIAIPILVGPCDWTNQVPFIANLQMLPGKPTPLINYTDNDASFEGVRVDILIAIAHRLHAAPGDGDEENKRRILRGTIVIASYDQPVGDVDVKTAPLGLTAHTDERGKFEVDLTEVATAEVGETITFSVAGYKPATAQLQLEEDLLLSVTPEDWPECPECKHGNMKENDYCWQCGHRLREDDPPTSPDTTSAPIACPHCDAQYEADDCPNFCRECGSQLKEEQPASLRALRLPHETAIGGQIGPTLAETVVAPPIPEAEPHKGARPPPAPWQKRIAATTGIIGLLLIGAAIIFAMSRSGGFGGNVGTPDAIGVAEATAKGRMDVKGPPAPPDAPPEPPMDDASVAGGVLAAGQAIEAAYVQLGEILKAHHRSNQPWENYQREHGGKSTGLWHRFLKENSDWLIANTQELCAKYTDIALSLEHIQIPPGAPWSFKKMKDTMRRGADAGARRLRYSEQLMREELAGRDPSWGRNTSYGRAKREMDELIGDGPTVGGSARRHHDQHFKPALDDTI